jgi:hypothetical protein
MSAGALCVHPNFAGLPDTTGGMTMMYQGHSDHNIHANIFYQALGHAIETVNDDETQNYLKFVKTYADNRFNWNRISSQWEGLLNQLKGQYPTLESRALPKVDSQGKPIGKFVYQT